MKYLEENPGFVYSKAEDGIFCLPCVLFATKDNLGQFVCKGTTLPIKAGTYAELKASRFLKKSSTMKGLKS